MLLKYAFSLVLLFLAGCRPPNAVDAFAEAKVKQMTAEMLAAQRGKTSEAMRNFNPRKSAKQLEMH